MIFFTNFKLNMYEVLYKLLYKIFSLKSVHENQCVFCSIEENDKFGNLNILKKELRDIFPCFSCYGKLTTLAKVIRTAKKLAGAEIIFLEAAYTYASLIKIRKETTVVQCWHAAGAFKKMGMHTIDPNLPNEVNKQNILHGYYDYVVVSSVSVVDTYAEAFNMPTEKILPLGIPRIQHLLEKAKEAKQCLQYLYCKHDGCRYNKIILYAPTFREVKGKRSYTPNLNIEDFAAQLPADYVLGVRLHPRASSKIKLPANVFNFSKLNYEIALICSDILITDYSSIVFDFAALGKPVFFYTPDEIFYERGLYFSPKMKYPEITYDDYYDIINLVLMMNSDKKINDQIIKIATSIRNEYIEEFNIYNFLELTTLSTLHSNKGK